MAEYFSLQELQRSDAAARLGIDNTPPPEARNRLSALINNCLDPIRRLWGAPVIVNSGFRCPALNKAVGGAPASSHLRGEAADITTGSHDGNRRLFGMILDSGLDFDQLIDERNYSWLHVSYRAGNNRRQVLHLR